VRGVEPGGGALRTAAAGLLAVAAVGLAGAAFAPAYADGALVRPLLAALVPVVAAVLVLRGGARGRWRPAAGASLGLLVLVVTVLGVGLHGLRGAAVDGWATLLVTTPPAPARGDLVLFVGLLTLLAAVGAAELAMRLPSRLLALLPALALVAVAAAFAPAGRARALLTAAGLAAAGAGLRLLRDRPVGVTDVGDGAADRRDRLAAVPPAVAALATVAVVAPLLTLLLPGAAQLRPYQLREHRTLSLTTAAVADPLAAVRVLTGFEPSRELFRLSTATRPELVRLVALDTYDGQTWRPSDAFRPLGATVDPDPRVTVPTQPGAARVTVTSLDGPWLPAVDRPRSVAGVDAGVDVRTGDLVARRGVRGADYDLRWDAAHPTLGELRAVGQGIGADVAPLRELPDGAPEALKPLAERLTGPSDSPPEQALLIERWLQGGVQDAGAPSGYSWGRTQQMITEGAPSQRRGTSDQFASTAALLLRASGLPARVVVGFRVPAQPDPGTATYVVRGADAYAWPEVLLDSVGWVPLAPVPGATSRSPDAADLPGTAGAAGRLRDELPDPEATPAPPPPDRVTPPVRIASRVPAWLVGLLAVAGLLLALAGALAAVVTSKGLRRRRRRRTGDPALRVVAAWEEARDVLADHGWRVPPGATPREVAGVAAAGTPATQPALSALVDVLDAAVWSRAVVAPRAGDDAWQANDELCRVLRRRRLPARLRARVDPRTLARR